MHGSSGLLSRQKCRKFFCVSKINSRQVFLDSVCVRARIDITIRFNPQAIRARTHARIRSVFCRFWIWGWLCWFVDNLVDINRLLHCLITWWSNGRGCHAAYCGARGNNDVGFSCFELMAFDFIVDAKLEVVGSGMRAHVCIGASGV